VPPRMDCLHEGQLSYRLFFEPLYRNDWIMDTDGINKAKEFLEEQRKALWAVYHEHFAEHLWYRDVFSLSLVVPPGLSSNHASETSVIRPMLEERPHLHGLIHVSESMTDLWFTAHVISFFTTKFPSIVATIIDVDGEFLLIEASPFLPSNLQPAICNNRVFLRNGNVLYIPMPQNPAQLAETAKYPIRIDAFVVFSALDQWNLPPRAQACLRDRMLQASQEKYHVATFDITPELARLLQHPDNWQYTAWLCQLEGGSGFEREGHTAQKGEEGIESVALPVPRLTYLRHLQSHKGPMTATQRGNHLMRQWKRLGCGASSQSTASTGSLHGEKEITLLQQLMVGSTSIYPRSTPPFPSTMLQWQHSQYTAALRHCQDHVSSFSSSSCREEMSQSNANDSRRLDSSDFNAAVDDESWMLLPADVNDPQWHNAAERFMPSAPTAEFDMQEEEEEDAEGGRNSAESLGKVLDGLRQVLPDYAASQSDYEGLPIPSPSNPHQNDAPISLDFDKLQSILLPRSTPLNRDAESNGNGSSDSEEAWRELDGDEGDDEEDSPLKFNLDGQTPALALLQAHLCHLREVGNIEQSPVEGLLRTLGIDLSIFRQMSPDELDALWKELS
jgi:hypothetical protein